MKMLFIKTCGIQLMSGLEENVWLYTYILGKKKLKNEACIQPKRLKKNKIKKKVEEKNESPKK